MNDITDIHFPFLYGFFLYIHLSCISKVHIDFRSSHVM